MKNISRMAASLSILLLSYGAAVAQPHEDQRGEPQRNEGQRNEGQRNEGQQDNGFHNQQKRQHPQQQRENEGGPDHPDWRRGQRMQHNEWQQGARFDYRERHLSAPPRGYEWREFNGNYVLGAIATGVIANIILNSGR